MGGLSVVSPQIGPRGSPQAQQERAGTPFWVWFLSFLKEELRPYPGRYLLASRYVLAATLTMLVIVTFRLPGAAVGGFYSLLLPRTSFRLTAQGAFAFVGSFASAMAVVVLGTMLFINYPLTHFLWVIGSFFLGFLAMAVMTNYAAASAFAILIVLTVPTWDARAPTAAIVVSNLWVIGSIAVALSSTLLVELLFAFFASKSQLDTALCDQLAAVRVFLKEMADGTVRSKTRNALQHFAIVGTSGLHSLAVSGNVGTEETARRSAEVSLVGRMVDLVASLDESEGFASEHKPRLLALATKLKSVQARLQGATSEAKKTAPQALEDKWPLLFEAERTADLLSMLVSGGKVPSRLVDLAQPATPPFFVPDAWSNPAHLHFALRGCLALVICYTLFNAVAWPNLSTSLFTVVITTLSSTGSSRQKLLLRVSGALIGGLLLGMGSQVFILPLLNGLTGFTVLFVTVTCVAAWFITSSPRLSYFGTQMALAFYIIQLSAPFAQYDLAAGRDNFLGDLLGLVVMGIVYKSVRSTPAVLLMRELLVSNLQLMAKLAAPRSANQKIDAEDLRTLRQKISLNFSAVNVQADGVLFEGIKPRPSSLRLRNKLLGLRPGFRRLFLVQIALLQYLTPLRSTELPEGIVKAQAQLKSSVRSLLEGMAKNLSGKPHQTTSTELRQAYKGLRESANTAYGEHVTPRAQAVLALSSRLVESTIALMSDLEGVEKE